MAAAQPLKIRMVAGLGNPGEEYAETRHNAGFKAIDELARQAGVTYWKNQAGAEVALININDTDEEGGKRQIVLVKAAVVYEYLGWPHLQALPRVQDQGRGAARDSRRARHSAGDVRVKVGGGHAGHNGLRSIIDKMGSRDFSRIRTGIGNPPGKMPVADYVLKQLRARPRISRTPAPAPPTPPAWQSCTARLCPRPRQRCRLRQRQALKPPK